MANLYSLAELIGKPINVKKLIAMKCEMFLNVFQQNLELELELEDTIETIIKNDNPEAFEAIMTVECKGGCMLKVNRNQVNYFIIIRDYFFDFFYFN